MFQIVRKGRDRAGDEPRQVPAGLPGFRAGAVDPPRGPFRDHNPALRRHGRPRKGASHRRGIETLGTRYKPQFLLQCQFVGETWLQDQRREK